MSTTIANKMITLGQANLRACFLLMAMVFFLAGTVPQYLDYFDNNKMELAENQESDREAEEKESKEEDDHLSQMLSYKSWYPEETSTFYGSFSYWNCLYFDIITPPPEQV